MTDKEELIKAAETLKKYCEEHCDIGCSDGDTGCLFSDVCYEYFIQYGGICELMSYFIDEVLFG